MDLKVQVKAGDGTKPKADALVVLVEQDRSLKSRLKDLKQDFGDLAGLPAAEDFTGKAGQVTVLTPEAGAPAGRVMLVGLGEKPDANAVRKACGTAVRKLQEGSARKANVLLDKALRKFVRDGLAQVVAEGAMLGSYRFTELKNDVEDPKLRTVVLVTPKEHLEADKVGAEEGTAIAESVGFARDIGNRPGNVSTPSGVASAVRKEANRVRSKKLTVKVFGESVMEKKGMQSLLGVSRGSDEEAKFIEISWQGARKSDKPIVLVGKCLTFDTGGISLKPASKMEDMKFDMQGAAAVHGAVLAAARLQLPLNVVGLTPASENMPGGSANKPGDIRAAMSGKTIEIINTDAEGRLILADALCYADEFKPRAVVDLATLTGACVVALGKHTCGMMGTHDGLMNELRDAADRSGERVWQLPLHAEYTEQIQSSYADVKNVGGREAGAITAGAFLKEFTSDWPWAHLDIAGVAWNTDDGALTRDGGTGFGVRLLTELLRAACGKGFRA